MRRIKSLIFLIFLVFIVLSTLTSICFLVIFSFLYLQHKVDIDINELTVSFYLTFGLALLTALLLTYAYIYYKDLDAAFRGEEK